MGDWEKINTDKYFEDEIVCYSCGNSNTANITPPFAFFEYEGEDDEYDAGTILCQTCLIAEGVAIADESAPNTPKKIRTKTKIKLGNFNVSSKKLVVGDPCYNLKSHCLINDLHALQGEWKSYLVLQEGERHLLLAHHSAYPIRSNAIMDDLYMKVPVDSGQIGIHDRKYWGKKSAVPKGFFPKGYVPLIDDDDPWYEAHCKVTQSASEAGVLPHGCVTSTAYGDGTYLVEGIKNNGKFVAIRIHLI